MQYNLCLVFIDKALYWLIGVSGYLIVLVYKSSYIFIHVHIHILIHLHLHALVNFNGIMDGKEDGLECL